MNEATQEFIEKLFLKKFAIILIVEEHGADILATWNTEEECTYSYKGEDFAKVRFGKVKFTYANTEDFLSGTITVFQDNEITPL